jgi:ATP phosphoribosyltransferase
MFKLKTDKELILELQRENKKLKSIVGELPKEQLQEIENTLEEVKQPTISDKVVTLEEEIEVIFGSGA